MIQLIFAISMIVGILFFFYSLYQSVVQGSAEDRRGYEQALKDIDDYYRKHPDEKEET